MKNVEVQIVGMARCVLGFGRGEAVRKGMADKDDVLLDAHLQDQEPVRRRSLPPVRSVRGRRRRPIRTGFACFQWGIVGLLLLDVACAREREPKPDTEAAPKAPLTSAQVGAARQAGLLLPAYAEFEWIDPVGPAGTNPIYTQAVAVNQSGVVAGNSFGGASGLYGGGPYPFIKDSSGVHYVPGAVPNGANFVQGLGDDGTVAGFGGPPDSVLGTAGWQVPFLRRPDGTYEDIAAPAGTMLGRVTTDVSGRRVVLATTAFPGLPGSGPGAIAHWLFDGNGTDTVNGNNLPTLPGDFQQDASGTYLRMDGNRCLSIPAGQGNALSTNDNAGVTMLARIRVPVNACPSTFRPITMRTWESALAMGCLPDGSGVGIEGYFYQGAASVLTPLVGNIAFGQWAHVAITWDHHTVRSYVNGEQVGSQPQTGPFIPSGDWFSVGCEPQYPSVDFVGDVSDVAMLRTPLAPDQIKQYYNGNGVYSSAPLGNQWARYQINGDSSPEYTVLEPLAGTQYLGTGSAVAISKKGTIVGTQVLSDSSTTAAIYTSDQNGGVRDLNDLRSPEDAEAWTFVTATGINDADLVAGLAKHNGLFTAFTFDLNSREIVDLGYLEGSWNPAVDRTTPRSMNAAGHVVGAVEVNGTAPAAPFIYTKETGITNLNEFVDPTKLEGGWVLQDAYQINDDDVIAGVATNAAGERRGFKLQVPGLPPAAKVACIGKADGDSCSTGKTCGTNNVCFGGVCGGGDPADNVCLQLNGVVNVGGTKWVAVFGFDNRSQTVVMPTVEQVTIDGNVITDPDPAPPAWLDPGSHPGAFLPSFDASATVTWQVNGQKASASASSTPQFTKQTDELGDYVMYGRTRINLPPTPGAAIQPTALCLMNPSSQLYMAVFGYTNLSGHATTIPAGDDNFVTVEGAPVTPSSSIPTFFASQGNPVAFSVPFGVGPVVWTIGGASANIDLSSPPCHTKQDSQGTWVDNGAGTFVLLIPDNTAAIQASIVLPDILPGNSDPSKPSTTVGKTGGSFSVSNRGSAQYHIPLWVPEGQGGLKPALSLDYDSAHEDGLLGVGWGVTGLLSQIKRCEPDYMETGSTWQLNFIDDDLCMDGVRLVQYFPGIYRRQDGDPTQIVANTSPPSSEPQSFTATTADGRKFIYGGGNASLSGLRTQISVDAGGAQSSVNSEVTYAWSLASVQDTFGNQINITYAKDSDSCDPSTDGCYHYQRPIRMSYSNGTRLVNFNYNTRSTIIYHNDAGFRVMEDQILTTIDMMGPPADSNGTPQLLREYALTFNTGSVSGRQRLTQLLECDGPAVSGSLTNTTVCKPPTTFQWDDGQSTYTLQPVVPFVAGNKPMHIQPADINGDGRDDLIYYYSGPNGATTATRLSTGTGFGDEQPQGAGNPGTGPDWLDASQAIQTFDFNADGKTDMLGLIKLQGAQSVFTGNNSGGLLGLSGAGETLNPIFSIEGNTEFASYFIDMDGDGLPDELTAVPTNWLAHQQQNCQDTSDPMRWNLKLNVSAPYWEHLQPIVEGTSLYSSPITFQTLYDCSKMSTPNVHFNAGHITSRSKYDVLRTSPANSVVDELLTLNGNKDAVAINNTAIPVFSNAESGVLSLTSSPGHTDFIGDFNGDGLDDVVTVLVTSASWNAAHTAFAAPVFGDVWISTGSGLVHPPSTPATPVTFTQTGPAGDGGTRVGDCNNDGKMDFIFLGGTPTTPFASCMASTGDGVFPTVTPLATSDGGNVLVRPDGDYSWLEDYHENQLMDVNGDGLQDILVTDSAGFHVYLRDGFKPDLLIGITDGAGANTGLDYRPLVNARYSYPTSPADAPVYPQVSTKKGWVVNQYQLDAGLQKANLLRRDLGPPRRQFNMSYQDGRSDAAGRGWLGFAVVQTQELNPDGSVYSTLTQTFDNSSDLTIPAYPKAGMLTGEKKEVVLPPKGGATTGTTVDIVKNYTNTIVAGTTAHRYWAVRPTKIVETTTENGTTVWNVETDQTFDPTYAYLTSRCRTALIDGDVESWKYTFYPDSAFGDATPFAIDRLQTLTHGSGGTCAAPTSTRTEGYTYEGASHILSTETTQAGGGPAVEMTMSFDYNSYGAVSSVKRQDTLGNIIVESLSYDADGVYPVSAKNAMGHVTTMAYHPGLGVLVKSTDPNGIVESSQFDTFGRLHHRQRFDASGNADLNDVTMAYTGATDPSTDAKLSVVTTTFGTGRVEEMDFDRLNRLTATKVAMSASGTTEVDRSYDLIGNMVGTSAPHFTSWSAPVPGTSFSYDNLGRIQTVTESTIATPVLTYSYSGRRTTVQTLISDPNATTPRQSERYVDTDDFGRVSRTGQYKDDGTELYMKYDYPSFSELKTITVQGDVTNQTSYGYDAIGRQTSVTKPDSGQRSYQLDAFGRQTSTTDGEGNSTTFFKDALDRVTLISDATGTSTLFWDDGPFGVGHQSGSYSVDGVAIDRQFSSFGQPTVETYAVNGQNFGAQTSYDSMGRVQTVTYPTTPGYDPFETTYSYDSFGALSAITDKQTNVNLWSIGDGQGREPSGAVRLENLGSELTSQRSHDALTGFLTGISTVYQPAGNATMLQSDGFSYYANGSLETRTTSPGTVETFGYDALNRLQDWDGGAHGWHVTYQYGDDGNLQQRIRQDKPSDDITFNYGENGAGRHAVTSTSSTAWGTYTYDQAGRQLTGLNRTVESYTNFDLPRAVTTSNGETTLLYDVGGKRVVKDGPLETDLYLGKMFQRITTKASGAQSYVLFVYNDERVVAEIKRVGGEETILYQQADNVGTPRASFSNGMMTRTFVDPFGNETDPTDPGVPGTGQTATGYGLGDHSVDGDLGLVNFGGRLMDPAVGRFITADPMVSDPYSSQGRNPYSLALNNPTTFTDPSGYQAVGPAPDTGASGTDPTGQGSANLVLDANNSQAKSSQFDWQAFYERQSVRAEAAREAAQGGAGSGPSDSLVEQMAYQNKQQSQQTPGASIGATREEQWGGAPTNEGVYWGVASPQGFGPSGPAAAFSQNSWVLGAMTLSEFETLSTNVAYGRGGGWGGSAGGTLMAQAGWNPVMKWAEWAVVGGNIALGMVTGPEEIVGSLAAEAAPEALQFSQTTASAAFDADGIFAGKTIGELAADLRAGKVAVSDVPVGVTNGLIVNTRSSLALMRAGIPRSNWVLIDVTESEGANITRRLIRNGLGPEGTPTLRVTGLGRGASSLK